MAQPNGSPPSQVSSRRESRSSRLPQILVHLWNEWRVEIFIVLVVAFAIFLLVERMQIRQAILSWLQQGLQVVKSSGQGVLRGFVAVIQSTTLSDLAGYVLLLVASAFVLWRMRWRLMHMPRFTSPECPHCGGELNRIHRRPADRLVSLFVPVARYRCKNSDCRWGGLRVKRTRHE